MTDTERLSILERWAFGNGSKGADERIHKNTENINDDFMGERKCMAHNKIDAHLDWHRRNKIFMWAILVPVYLSLLTLILQMAGVIN